MSERSIAQLKSIAEDVVSLDMDGTKQLVKNAIKSGISPIRIINEGLLKGLEVVGRNFKNGEFFLSELIMVGEIMKEAMAIVEPLLKLDEVEARGTVVIGSVEGDLHDIGKNIVATMLRSAGFVVHDLGVDVPAEEFVKKIKEEKKVDILALSALITVTMDNIPKVIQALEDSGFRERVKVIVGGAPLNEEYARKVGAAYAPDAIEAVRKCKELIEVGK